MGRAPRLSEHARAAIASEYAAGVSKASIARKHRCSLPSVERWGTEGAKAQPNFTDKHRSGRPRLVPAAKRGSIKRSAKRDKSIPEITAAYNKNAPQPVSESTIRRTVAAGRDPLAWQPINRGRVLSDINKEKRVTFCEENKKAHVSKWVFVDGKYFYLYKTSHGFALWSWAKPGSQGAPRCKGNPWVFFVYAAVAQGHKSKLYYVSPSPEVGTKARSSKVPFNGRHFRDMMAKMVPKIKGWFKGKGNWYMVLDRASQHTSAPSKAKLVQLGVTLRAGFLPQS